MVAQKATLGQPEFSSAAVALMDQFLARSAYAPKVMPSLGERQWGESIYNVSYEINDISNIQVF